MGAGVSSLLATKYGGACETGMEDLPEGCVAAVLLHLDPQEICRLATLGRVFRGAATADIVWETKLPRDYKYLLEKAAAGRPAGAVWGLCKKEIYARLSRPNPFDGGTKEFWLDKTSGGICMSISSKALAITGMDDRRYWNVLPTEESRFHVVAYLQQIWWFEVSGEVDFQFPQGTYSLFFRLHLGRPLKRLGRKTYNPEHIHGWDIKPVKFQLSTSDGQQALSKCYLDDAGSWIYYQVGDFVVENSFASTKLKFSMTLIDCTHSKGGVCVDSVVIYKKGYEQEKALSPYG